MIPWNQQFSGKNKSQVDPGNKKKSIDSFNPEWKDLYKEYLLKKLELVKL